MINYINIKKNGNIAREIITQLSIEHAFINEVFQSVNNCILNISLELPIETKLNDFNELNYHVDESEKIVVEFNGKVFHINYTSNFEYIIDLLDDDILHALNDCSVVSESNDGEEETLEILKEKIKNIFPIESLYYRIKHKEEKGINYNYREDCLYYIVLQKHLVKDSEIIKDFLDNFYNSKYVDVFYNYISLPRAYYDKLLKDPSVENSIKKDIVSKIEELPAVEEILKTNNFSEIESYYFKLWDNINIVNKGEIALKIFNKGFTTERMIRDLLNRFDESMVLNNVLMQFKCPEDIMINNLNNDFYHITIVSNTNTSSKVLSSLLNQYLIDYSNNLLIQKIKNHKNLSDLDLQSLKNRDLILSIIEDGISSDNISTFVKLLENPRLLLSKEEIKKINKILTDSSFLIHETSFDFNQIDNLLKSKQATIAANEKKIEEYNFIANVYDDFQIYSNDLEKELKKCTFDESNKLIPTDKLIKMTKHPFFASCSYIVNEVTDKFNSFFIKNIENANIDEITRTLDNIAYNNGAIIQNIIHLPTFKQVEIWNKAKTKVDINLIDENTKTYFNNIIEFKKS